MLSCVEHEKSFITSGPAFYAKDNSSDTFPIFISVIIPQSKFSGTRKSLRYQNLVWT